MWGQAVSRDCRRATSSSGNRRATPAAHRMKSRSVPSSHLNHASTRSVSGMVYTSVQSLPCFADPFSTSCVTPAMVGITA